MLAILPVICLVFLFLVFQSQAKQKDISDWRCSFITASVVWGLIVVAITELLNLFNLIKFSYVLALWILTILILAVILFALVNKTRFSLRSSLSKPSVFSLILIFGVILIVLTIGLIAFIAPTNNWDSMTYHMPKVSHWIQNQNIQFYPTSILRQNHQNPGAEYFILHLQILSGTDRFANLVQWFAMLGSIVAVSFIAKSLGGNAKAQVFAAVFAAAFPMGILQASSTQTDYCVAFWLLCFIYYIIELRKEINWFYFLATGISLGLAILTKATTYIYAAPFLLWFVLSQFKRLRLKASGPIFVVALIVISINAGHCFRNYELYGNPLGPMKEVGENTQYSNEVHTIPAMVSNIARNVGTHIQTPYPNINSRIANSFESLHKAIGIDISDPRTTFETTKFSIGKFSFNDEVDGNPFHMLLVIISYILVLIVGRLRRTPDILKYSLAVLGGFLFFCLYLKWQPWHSRLHTPLFVMWAPFVAVVFSKIFNRIFVNSLAVVILLLAVPWLLHCQTRPLIGENNIFKVSRNEQYFAMPIGIKGHFLQLKDYLKDKNPSQIGLYLGDDTWEYPLWVLLRQDSQDIRFEHINVTNASSKKYDIPPFDNFSPDTIISIDRDDQNEILVKDNVYVKKWSSGRVRLYFKP